MSSAYVRMTFAFSKQRAHGLNRRSSDFLRT
jgi:hypothetical protein